MSIRRCLPSRAELVEKSRGLEIVATADDEPERIEVVLKEEKRPELLMRSDEEELSLVLVAVLFLQFWTERLLNARMRCVGELVDRDIGVRGLCVVGRGVERLVTRRRVVNALFVGTQ